jgi:hypothetical protein
VHACNPSTQDAQAGGLQTRDHARLFCKTLSQKKVL